MAQTDSPAAAIDLASATTEGLSQDQFIGSAVSAYNGWVEIVDLDVAKSLGGILKKELQVQREVLGFDGIDVGDLDFVDFGEATHASEVVPATVKSLMFPGSR